MSLYITWTNLCTELDKIEIELRDFAANTSDLTSGSLSLAQECLLEGLLSRLWQAWGNYWRECIIKSCMGTIDGAATNIAGLPVATSEEDVSGAAIKAKKAKSPYWGTPNSTLRYEPTWGDSDALTKIILGLNPSNGSQLSAAVSLVSTIAKDIQTIRNCAAHTNRETLAELAKIRTRYITFPLPHPVHSLFWEEPSTNNYLVLFAIDEFRNATLMAIS